MMEVVLILLQPLPFFASDCHPRQTDLILELCKLDIRCLLPSAPPLPPPPPLSHLTSSILILSTHPCIGNAGPPFQSIRVFMSHFTSHLGAGVSTESRCLLQPLLGVCAHESLTTHWIGAQAIWETCISHVNSVDETREDGVCHTLNWTMWQQPSL